MVVCKWHLRLLLAQLYCRATRQAAAQRQLPLIKQQRLVKACCVLMSAMVAGALPQQAVQCRVIPSCYCNQFDTASTNVHVDDEMSC